MGEAVNVTAVVVAQFRTVSGLEVAAYGPRAEGVVDHMLMVADRLDVLHHALMAVLTIGFSAGVADDRACLNRLPPVNASFTSAATGLRRHTQSNLIMLSGFAARDVMSEVVNDDLPCALTTS